MYQDWEIVNGINGEEWYYSDKCFLEVCKQLKKRLKHWCYCGESEMIFLQNSACSENGSLLDFGNYVYIDINYGIKNGYIDSFPRFMERVLNACKSEVDAKNLMNIANKMRLSHKKIIESTLNADKSLPESVKTVMKKHVIL